MLQSLTKLVAKKKKVKIRFLKVLYFLNLKGYEMHLFGLAKLKPFANWYWVVLQSGYPSKKYIAALF